MKFPQKASIFLVINPKNGPGLDQKMDQVWSKKWSMELESYLIGWQHAVVCIRYVWNGHFSD